MRTRARTTTVIALTLLAVTTSGCVGEPTATETTAGAASPRATEASPTPAPTGTPAAEPTADAATGAACLNGEWLATEAGLQRFYEEFSAISGGVGFTSSGTATLTLADGAFTWAPDTVVAVDTGGIVTDVTLGGTISGTYNATDDTITTDVDVANDLAVTATVEGVEIDASGVSELIAQAPIANSNYTCTADTLELVTAFGDASATTVLERR